MQCPRCHQPIDGPEEYICCGAELLEWRCRDCGKVSEGFAFPYGMCPLCDGRLDLLAPRDLDPEHGTEALRVAFEIELGGHAFYTQAARETGEPGLQELFLRLAEMECEHMDTLARRYRVDLPPAPERSGVARAAIFAGVPSRPDDPANLFRIAIACEERAAVYFSDKRDEAAPGSPEHDLYQELAAEERAHAELLATELERWKSGKRGLL